MSYTTREESEKLIKFGIDVDTADLIYVSNFSYPSILPGVVYSVVKNKLIGKYETEPLPAWTTDSLLNILPKKISDKYQLLIFPDLTTGMWVCMYDKIGTHENSLEATGDINYHKSILKMVYWYLEKIKEVGT